jgi:hypothetical protein
MDPRLHQYLEGDVPAAALPDEVRTDAAAWDEMLAAVRRDERPHPWLEGRVMHAVASRASRPAWRRHLEGLLGTRVALAAGVAALSFAAGWMVTRRAAVAPTPLAQPAEVVFVQFAVEAPGARTVTISGSFNDWAAEATPLSDADGDGLWTALVPLGPGVHQYMFVVDEVEWVTDPRAGRYVDDGFGRSNAVVAVARPASPAS